MTNIKIRYNLLVVEDNPGDYVLLEDYLEETKIVKKISWAKSYKAAVKIVEEADGSFDLIFLDLSLPDNSGEELIEDIQKLSNSCPIIILTGYTDADFAVRSLSLGASDYLVKDVLNPTILSKTIIYNIERNKILVNLKDSEQRYSDLFHFSPLPLWVFDQDTLKFLDVNDASIFHYGYSYKEFLEMDITEIMNKDSIEDFKSVLSSLQESHQNLFIGLQEHIKKDGKVIQVELRANSYVYNGRAAEIISINDVTEKNKQIQAIERQNKVLREIAWTQSHVVRAPLARLMGLVALLKEGRITGDKTKEFYQHIENSADELDDIIKDVVRKSQQIDINKDEE